MSGHAGQVCAGPASRAARRPGRGRAALAGLAVAAAGMLSCASAMAAPPSRAPAPQYLFSIPSGSGSLTGPDDRHLTLRLADARRYLTRFTDPPLRQAALVASADFARRFAGSFPGAAPNAVLTYTPRGAQIPVSIVLTVTTPRWNAKQRAWTFAAIRIRKTPDTLPGTTVRIQPPRIPNPRAFAHATLRIDARSATINGCAVELHARCVGAATPIDLSGAGVADALGGFLAHLFTTRIPSTAGEQFLIGLAVNYASPLTARAGAQGATSQVPVMLLPPTVFAPRTDPRVQPRSFVCTVEAMIVGWQSVENPAAGGSYIFTLSVYGPGQAPIYTATLRYSAPPGGRASPGCG